MTALQDQLDEMTANTRKLVQPERLAVGEQAVAELFGSGIEEKILPVGAIAPSFALNDATGRLVRSEDMLALGPLVIKFIRGRWCSYCATELEAWRDLYGTLRERGAFMVAISPQTERQNDFMAGQHGLPFPVLSDPGCALAGPAVRPRLHRPPVPPRLLPLHPGQHPLHQRRAKLASTPARNLRSKPRRTHSPRRSSRRLPRPSRAGRSVSRRNTRELTDQPGCPSWPQFHRDYTGTRVDVSRKHNFQVGATIRE